MDDIERLKYEIKKDAVDRVFREHPHDAVTELEKLGFCYIEDSSDEEEAQEERAAVPQTTQQQELVRYFEGNGDPGDDLLHAFITEKNRDEPNYALFRRYFKQGNERLKALLLYGLSHQPTDADLMSDLAFMHIFSPMLRELIAHYTLACEQENDPAKFHELARDFYTNTSADGYEALHALAEKFPCGTEKHTIVQQLQQEYENDAEAVAF